MICARVAGVPQSALAHRVAKFLVLDELARAFHGGEQRAFVEAGRRLGLAFLDLDRLGLCRLAFLHGAERLLVLARGPACRRRPSSPGR